jgi:hypothetical protein
MRPRRGSVGGRSLHSKDLSPSVIRLFLEKINKTDTCWLWTAHTDRNGYGLAYAGRRPGDPSSTFYAHRMAYAIAHGEIPTGVVVMHTCDVPACVNPEHLKLATQSLNVKDRDAKGRGAKERPTIRKITVEGVREIRESNQPADYFARKWDVCVSHIKHIRAGRRRKVA